MTPDLTDDLRDQIADAIDAHPCTPKFGQEYVINAVMPVVQAAVTEARREALLSAADWLEARYLDVPQRFTQAAELRSRAADTSRRR